MEQLGRSEGSTTAGAGGGAVCRGGRCGWEVVQSVLFAGGPGGRGGQALPLLGVDGIYSEGRARRKFHRHGRNFKPCLVFYVLAFFFFGPAWTFPT